jgi:general secretion pathway protein G
MSTLALKSRAGFTLIELMIVVAIVGLLSTIAVPKFADMSRKAREAATKGRLGSLRSAISIYYSDNDGHYPDQADVGLTNSKKYLAEIPFADVPPYHNANGIENWMGYVSHDPGPGNPNGWAYLAPGSGSNGNDFIDGGIYVYCIHADSKGNVWSSE